MEKVGNIFLDLSLNLDKNAKAKVVNEFEGLTGKIGNRLKSGFSNIASNIGNVFKSKLALASIVGGVAMGIAKANDTLKDMVGYWDKMATQADSFKMSLTEMSNLKAVADYGDLPDFDGFLKSLIVFKKSMGELKLGQDTDGAKILKNVGLKGDEDVTTALKTTISSMSKSDEATSDLALPILFGKINSENLQAFKGGLLPAFSQVDDDIKTGKIRQIKETDKRNKDIGNTDLALKRVDINKYNDMYNNFDAKSIAKEYEAMQKISQEYVQAVSKVVAGATDMAEATDKVTGGLDGFFNKITFGWLRFDKAENNPNKNKVYSTNK